MSKTTTNSRIQISYKAPLSIYDDRGFDLQEINRRQAISVQLKKKYESRSNRS